MTCARKSSCDEPEELFELAGDGEVVSEHVERRDDVGPLQQLAQRSALVTVLSHVEARLATQKTEVNEDLEARASVRSASSSSVLNRTFRFGGGVRPSSFRCSDLPALTHESHMDSMRVRIQL